MITRYMFTVERNDSIKILTQEVGKKNFPPMHYIEKLRDRGNYVPFYLIGNVRKGIHCGYVEVRLVGLYMFLDITKDEKFKAMYREKAKQFVENLVKDAKLVYQDEPVFRIIDVELRELFM